MKTPQRFLFPLAAVGVLGALLPAMRNRDDDDDEIPFAEAKIRIEVNSTDGDAGIQAFLDGEPWDRVAIEAPDGRRILEVRGRRKLGELGMTELFFESNEPSFDELPLDEFLKKFPEGLYEFSGRTVDGEELESCALLTHDIPAGPVLVSPADGSVQDPSNTVIDWDPVTDPPGIQIVEYEVIVEQIDPLRVLSVHVPASVTSLTVPPEFFEAGEDYQFEVLAIEIGGNQTISEAFFSVQ